jgi:membrane-associated phospholipid phosphatase
MFLIAGAILINKFEKGDEILYLSSIHTPFFDQVFKWITRFAEAPLLVLLIVIALRVSYGYGFILGLNCLFTFLVTQILKYLIFANEVRPSVYFEGKAHLNFVQGVEVFQYHSFPSGHTSTAFALFFMLSLLVANRKWALLFFPMALLVGISRVYLLEHFFRDIYFGSIVGVCVTSVFYVTFVSSNYYSNIQWKDKAWLK